VNFDSASKPIDLIALAVADETFVASEATDAVHQAHGMIHALPGFMPGSIWKLFFCAGPFLAGSGLGHFDQRKRASPSMHRRLGENLTSDVTSVVRQAE
jgi:hypothetical protein